MSFSKRYATNKNSSKPPVSEEPLKTPVENPYKRSLEFKQLNEKKFFSREKFAQKKAALKQQQELLNLKRHQASRLNSTSPTEKSEFNFPWKTILVMILILAVVFIGSATWRFKNQWLFPIRHVHVEGNITQIHSSEFQKIVGAHAKGSLVLLNLQHLQKEILALPWVSSASVERLWPNTLVIHVMQKTPIARFGDTQLVDKEGRLFSADDDDFPRDLPVITGPPDRSSQLLQDYLSFNQSLAPIGLSITQLNVSPRLSYSLTLNNGIVLLLGANQVLTHLKTFVKVYPAVIQPKTSEIDHVDMRYNSGMAIGWKAEDK